MTSPSGRHVAFRTCATVGNFGPGFDVMSLALADRGDHITLAYADDGVDRITMEGPLADEIPVAWDRNVIGRTIDHLRGQIQSAAAEPVRLHAHVVKAYPGGSGLGSSASSAGGAALAFHALFPETKWQPGQLVEAAAAGEAVAGSGHADDVSAVIYGGIALVRHAPGMPDVRRIEPPAGMHLAIVRPDMKCETASMRAVLPRTVAWKDVTWNMGRVASIIAACARGDIADLGASLDDRLALPHRKRLLPHFDVTTDAARAAGAYGACLSGSGPAIAAVCDADTARDVAAAMHETVESLDLTCESFTAEPERRIPHEAVLR